MMIGTNKIYVHNNGLKEIRQQRSKSPKLTSIGRKYCQESSLHGIKYIAEESRTLLERGFWTLCTGTFLALAIYLIYRVFMNWQMSPLLVSFSSTQTPVWEIPFPAVTICNMNKVRKSKVEKIKEELEKNPEDEFYLMEEELVQEICHKTLNDAHNKHYDKDMNLTSDELLTYLKDLGHPCDEMILRCYFEGASVDCNEIFHITITDEGECCSLNIMPPSVMFRDPDHIKQNSEQELKKWSSWNIQSGYLHPPDKSHKVKGDDVKMPFRAMAPGLHMGLTILLDVKEEEYFCSGTESIGFKLLLHTPITQPEMVEYGFAVAPGTEAFFSVTPSQMKSDEDIHSIHFRRRQCFLDHEKKLEYFWHYSFLNCFMECLSNYTYQHCGCVDYYMPRHASYMPICSPDKAKCVEESLISVEENAYDINDENNGNSSKCECLPPCSDIEFPHETSVSKLSRSSLLHLDSKMLESHPELSNDSYVQNNLAIVHIYFKHLHFISNERRQLYGIIDFFSNIGGLLGLCLGFSFISAIEFLYFFTLRLYINVTTSRKEA